MFFKCREIVSLMNRAGRERVPFLFGVDFEMEDGFFIENPMFQSEIFFEINGIGNNSQIFTNESVDCKSIDSFLNIEPDFKYNNNNYQFDIFPEEYSKYKKRFDIVMKGLMKGDSYLANLTVRTPISTTLTLKDIFLKSSSPYKLYIPEKFVCFSPECFVKISDGKISTYPMKGTMDADKKDAEQKILNDDKEKAEHNTIVDLLRNDISRVAENVSVSRFRYIDKIKSNRGSLLQVSSMIEGLLNDTYLEELGSIIFKLLPAGSVSGAPKKATLDIICNAEQQARSYYTGVSGYFDGKSLNSFVLIRYIEQENSKLYFRSGGGITAKSKAEKEYREVIQKIYLPF